jgi:hypothetical protein
MGKNTIVFKFKALYRHFLGGTEKNHKISVRKAGLWAEI